MAYTGTTTARLGVHHAVGTDLHTMANQNAMIDEIDAGAERKKFIQSTTPASPVLWDIWWDTNFVPFRIKVWDGSKWVIIGGSMPAVLVQLNADFNIASSSISSTQINFTAADLLDTDSLHNPSSNSDRITIPTGLGGLWRIEGQARYESNANGWRGLSIFLNGATEIGVSSMMPLTGTGSPTSPLQVSRTYRLADNDYVNLNAQQTSGVTIAVIATATRFQATYIGP
jgi:hypothetical protein